MKTVFNPKPFEGKVVLITGSARGIGRATAVGFAHLGADVAALDIADPNAMPLIPYPLGSQEDLKETERLIKAEGVRALTIKADVRNFEAMKRAAKEVVTKFGRLDIVHANAGINVGPDSLDDYNPEMFNLALAVNGFGVANTIKAVAPHITAPGGRIIVTTSLEARMGYGNMAYGASK